MPQHPVANMGLSIRCEDRQHWLEFMINDDMMKHDCSPQSHLCAVVADAGDGIGDPRMSSKRGRRE